MPCQVPEYSPFDPAPWPPKNQCVIQNLGLTCIPEDWPAPNSGYYNTVPTCPDGKPMPQCPNNCEGVLSSVFGSGVSTVTFGGKVVSGGYVSTEGYPGFFEVESQGSYQLVKNNADLLQVLTTPGPDAGTSGKSPDTQTAPSGSSPTATVQTPMTGATEIQPVATQVVPAQTVPALGNYQAYFPGVPKVVTEETGRINTTVLFFAVLAVVAFMFFSRR